jgi:hypothetical protein
MYDAAKDLLDAYRSAPTVLQELLRDVFQQQAQAARGGDEGWSVVAVVCHLRDAEERALERTQLMRDQDDPFLAGYDQEQWARERTYAAADLDGALAAFLHHRSLHIAALDALPVEAWERSGQHEEQGRITIGGQVAHMVAHDTIHAAQIARQLSG